MLKNEKTSQIRVYKSDLPRINKKRAQYQMVFGDSITQTDIINLLLDKAEERESNGQDTKDRRTNGDWSA